jgi:hypothetical protein
MSVQNYNDHTPPYAFIQWKGTNVCMDVYCVCGAQMHIDADFAYYVLCPACEQYYETASFVILHPVTPKDVVGKPCITEFYNNGQANHYTVVAPEDNHRQCAHGWTIGGAYKCEQCAEPRGAAQGGERGHIP